MQFEGQWLLGKAAHRRVRTLEDILARKVVSEINAVNPKGHYLYAPWMSCKKRISERNFLNLDTAMYVDHSELKKIHEYLREDDGPNLGAMGMKASEFHVLHEDADAVYDFMKKASSALHLIWEIAPNLDLMWVSLIRQIIPLEPDSPEIKVRRMGSGISNHHYRGAIFTHVPIPEENRIEELAINLVHELGHQVLMVYQYADRLFECDSKTEVYSAIRRVHRPLVMSFHALVALTFMCEFTRLAAKMGPTESQPYFKKRFHEIIFDLQQGLKAVEHIKFTEFGALLVKEMNSVLTQARCA